MKKMKLLNIACGSRYHKDWVNIDFHPDSNLVKKVNILKGLPFSNDSFDAVYSSHFIEHLSKNNAIYVLEEAIRVLKKDGIIRIVVPDLENICREYINVLEKVRQNTEHDEEKYNWIISELLDQMVRNISGGEMGKIFNEVKKTKNMNLATYILYRTGDDLLNINGSSYSFHIKNKKITLNKLKNKMLYAYLGIIRLLIPCHLRESVFVNTTVGEKHLWMYDSYSMKKLLNIMGLKNIKTMKYNESSIPDFNSYLLDIKENGLPYKGISSLYIEATK